MLAAKFEEKKKKDMTALQDAYAAKFILDKFSENAVQTPHTWAANRIRDFLKLRNERREQMATADDTTHFEKLAND